MLSDDENSVKCVLFTSDDINYLLPESQVLKTIPLEMSAVFLKRKGWVLGKMMFKGHIIPVVSLDGNFKKLLNKSHYKLMIVQDFDEKKSIVNIAILIDSNPEYLVVEKNMISEENISDNAISCTIKNRKYILPQLTNIIMNALPNI